LVKKGCRGVGKGEKAHIGVGVNAPRPGPTKRNLARGKKEKKTTTSAKRGQKKNSRAGSFLSGRGDVTFQGKKKRGCNGKGKKLGGRVLIFKRLGDTARPRKKMPAMKSRARRPTRGAGSARVPEVK